MGQHPSQRRYPPELRERAVRMAQQLIDEQGGQRFGVVTRVARELGIGSEQLRSWLKQAEIDGGRRQGTSTAEPRGRRRCTGYEAFVTCSGRAAAVGGGSAKRGGVRTGARRHLGAHRGDPGRHPVGGGPALWASVVAAAVDQAALRNASTSRVRADSPTRTQGAMAMLHRLEQAPPKTRRTGRGGTADRLLPIG
jgi:transposase-like protein